MKRRAVLVAPSILSGDFGNLSKDAKRAEKLGADWIHVDIMDGHFVPNITIGPQAVKVLRKAVSIPLDVHLMLMYPQKYIKQFAEAGADFITVHVEAKHNVRKTLNGIKKLGCKCGIVLNPDTPVSRIKEYLKDVDLILIMSVYPGFSSQKFMPRVLPKVRAIRKLIDRSGRKIYLEIDGGIKIDNAHRARKLGADVLVSGSGVYGNKSLSKAIKKIRGV